VNWKSRRVYIGGGGGEGNILYYTFSADIFFGFNPLRKKPFRSQLSALTQTFIPTGSGFEPST
jgi:hypothetical protein